MNLKRYNSTNVKTIRFGKPTIRFNKQGQISFSSAIITAMGLKSGDKIELIQDEEKPKDWYVVKCKNDIGFPLREYKSSNALLTNSSGLVKTFMKSLEPQISNTTKSIGCLVAIIPTIVEKEKLFAIITKSAS